VSLLDFLRERLGLLGTEKGCDQVLVDGERILSCLALAVQYEGRPEFSHDELRERMSGNLCRCGAHLAGGTNLVEPKTNNQEESGWAVNPSASTTEGSIQTTEGEYSS
jgi:hypothetical protein